jgi:hypothetical protein
MGAAASSFGLVSWPDRPIEFPRCAHGEKMTSSRPGPGFGSPLPRASSNTTQLRQADAWLRGFRAMTSHGCDSCIKMYVVTVTRG